ncbi:TRAP transporter small permease [Microbacterium sp. No. 7]|uniref:TRAP transporter small permease n=1 Tax=Microbacterium sp. No. 7 TaxID=1714373 RepID=UPI0009E91DD1|nr:TRAP transporter small permease [Microbacterium sp. No. 7]
MNATAPTAHAETGVERTPFGYITATHPRLDRIQNAISAVCAVIASIAIVLTTILVIVGIVARAVFDAPIGWSVAFIEMYLLTATAFFGIVAAYRGGAHIAVVSLFNRMPERAKKPLLVLSYVAVLIGLGSLFWAGISGTAYAIAISMGPVPGSSELLIPGWIMQIIVPISMGLGIVVVGIDLVREVFSPWDAPRTNYEPGDDVDEAIAAVPVLTDDAFDTDAPPTTAVTQIPGGRKKGIR